MTNDDDMRNGFYYTLDAEIENMVCNQCKAVSKFGEKALHHPNCPMFDGPLVQW